ncbi:hypothetical protein NC652_004136 [Populus alba x Populus x berolinensis]|uniref:Uncharacterized protein n=1 Tax=Populus alba x Populus x berolinensis TaxID=444605 RepID=A0AAD6RTM8_9ROSI|nr:hypothetical protein NC652_004136 [Populus alba x Populus x berolinensis]KAJ7014747.1 hypothetical protein NC653_004141 [Populus alba x Populus x berolinensis]
MDTMISQSASLYMSKLAPWKEIDTTHLVLKQKNCSCEVSLQERIKTVLLSANN